MLHKVSTIGVVNLTSAIGHPIDILTRVVAYRLNCAVSVRPANDNMLIRFIDRYMTAVRQWTGVHCPLTRVFLMEGNLVENFIRSPMIIVWATGPSDVDN